MYCSRYLVLFLGIATLLLGGCRTMNDVLTDKKSGVAVDYPVSTDQAWDIAKTVFRWEGTDAIEEHKTEGFMLTSTGMSFGTYGTFMAAWVDPAPNSTSRVTVLTKRRVATGLVTDLTEERFHNRFSEAVQIVKSGRPLPITPPAVPIKQDPAEHW